VVQIRELHLRVPPTSTGLAMPPSFSTLKAAEDAKAVQVDADDPTKTVQIGAGQNPKYESELVDFF
jgi:hypothetical protein